MTEHSDGVARTLEALHGQQVYAIDYLFGEISKDFRGTLTLDDHDDDRHTVRVDGSHVASFRPQEVTAITVDNEGVDVALGHDRRLHFWMA